MNHGSIMASLVGPSQFREVGSPALLTAAGQFCSESLRLRTIRQALWTPADAAAARSFRRHVSPFVHESASESP